MKSDSIILQNVSLDLLRQIIGDSITKALASNNHQTQEESVDLWTRSETAKKLKITLPTLHDLTKTGKLTGYKIGGRVLYRSDEVLNSLQKIEAQKYARG